MCPAHLATRRTLITHRAYSSVGTSYCAIQSEFRYEIEPHLTWGESGVLEKPELIWVTEAVLVQLGHTSPPFLCPS